jgi:hypothetical protein
MSNDIINIIKGAAAMVVRIENNLIKKITENDKNRNQK